MATDSHALTPVEHSPVAGLAHDERGGISNVVLGMLLFITSEVMFFAGLFAAYFNVRANATTWPPNIPDTLVTGTNLRFKAEVGEYDANSCLFLLTPITTTAR